jgi:hypothetical protein
MIHVVVVHFHPDSSAINIDALHVAVTHALRMHPLLNARIQGNGEPTKRIDLFQMVRSNEEEPDPLMFVVPIDDDDDDYYFKSFSAQDIIQTENASHDWKDAFAISLDDASWCQQQVETGGPLWKIELYNQNKTLLFCFNHAISDQSSVNRLVDELLKCMEAYEKQQSTSGGVSTTLPKPHDMPMSIEEYVLGKNQTYRHVGPRDLFSGNTIRYVAAKAFEGIKNPVLVSQSKQQQQTSSSPSSSTTGWKDAIQIIAGQVAGGRDDEGRHSLVEFCTLDAPTTSELLTQCRNHGVSVSFALAAAVAMTTSNFVEPGTRRNLKILHSLDMRRFGKNQNNMDDVSSTVSCMAGSHDFMVEGLAAQSGQHLLNNPSRQSVQEFWSLAANLQNQTKAFIESRGPEEAVRVFDFAMGISDLNNLVHLTAQSKSTQGRAYSAAITNVGVYERIRAFQSESSMSPDATLKTKHGRFQIQDIFYATSHKETGAWFPVSAMTINGELKFTINPVAPIVSAEQNAQFADSFIKILKTIAQADEETLRDVSVESALKSISFPKHALTKATAFIGAIAVLTHAEAWLEFFQSVFAMKAAVTDPADFWAALNFWIFFAVGHPILQPILWISDVLHGSPGPLVLYGLVPLSFLLGNMIAIAAVTFSKEIRNAANIAALASFLTYVGAGLDGAAGLGDYNLALNDSYQGQVVRGCPAYEDVRQPSMDNFDLEKYQGLWYEQKFHDWTQFKEVYDTTLNIRLTENGRAWVDDFAVKGPAPDAAPKSWQASPVANGAHYFLFGRVDPNDPPGILREKGFGVEFPNYIVDVLKDPVTGEYREAIQFQCLERGGVRVFEGINFMSRSPTMSESEMAAMHARAQAAGMYPYGASSEQMHTVARRPVDAPELENSWQTMWRAIGFDKLLELVTQAIEDGGR